MSATVIAGGSTPRGAYPHIRRAGDFLFVSGTSCRQPDNSLPGVTVDEMGTARLDVRIQTHACIENLQSILRAVGAELCDLVDLTVFLVSMNDFADYNEAYGEHFGYDGPTRTTVAVHQLPHPHLLIEMKAVAFKPVA